jgi:hypothetical protein
MQFNHAMTLDWLSTQHIVFPLLVHFTLLVLKNMGGKAKANSAANQNHFFRVEEKEKLIS